MTDITCERPVANANTAAVNAHPTIPWFYRQTIQENAARLDGVNSIEELRNELKLIESLLLVKTSHPVE